MNLRIQIACCVFGALVAGIIAGSAAIVLVSGITSRDWKALKLEPVVKEAKVQALRGQPAGELIIRLDADAQSYSQQMVIVTTKLSFSAVFLSWVYVMETQRSDLTRSWCGRARGTVLSLDFVLARRTTRR